MSNTKRISLAKGLLVAAAVGISSGIGARADEPAAQGRPPTTSTRVAKERYLLRTDGQLIRGVISRDESTYFVAKKIGVIPIPKKQVERSFDTVQEAYQYKLARIPEDD